MAFHFYQVHIQTEFSNICEIILINYSSLSIAYKIMLAISMQLFLMAICSKLCLHFHLKIGSGSLVKKVYQQLYKQDCKTAPYSSLALCAGLGSRAARP